MLAIVAGWIALTINRNWRTGVLLSLAAHEAPSPSEPRVPSSWLLGYVGRPLALAAGSPHGQSDSKWGYRARVLALVFTFIFLIFPDEIAPRIAFYTETLNPNSSASEVGNRAWTYPIRNLLDALSGSHWAAGNGIGTASWGGQYVAKIIEQPHSIYGWKQAMEF